MENSDQEGGRNLSSEVQDITNSLISNEPNNNENPNVHTPSEDESQKSPRFARKPRRAQDNNPLLMTLQPRSTLPPLQPNQPRSPRTAQKSSRPHLSKTQPILPAKLYPTPMLHPPRKYAEVKMEEMPYATRCVWQAESESMFLREAQGRHPEKKSFLLRNYSIDYLKVRQHSIERVSTARRQQQAKDQKQRINDCRMYQMCVEREQKRDRIYNDEIFCPTAKQFRYIPNGSRSNPDNEYIFI